MGVAYADYDNDGWVDLVIGNHDEGYRLFHNESAAHTQNHWLTLELTGGERVNRDGIGSRVYVKTADGITQMQEVAAGSSLGAGNALPLYFGLGGHDSIEELTIVWPDGLSQTFNNVPGDDRYRLHYPAVVEAEPVPSEQTSDPQSPAVIVALTVLGTVVLLGACLITLGILVAALFWLSNRAQVKDTT